MAIVVFVLQRGIMMAKGKSGLKTITSASPPDAQGPTIAPAEPQEPETDEKGFKSHDDADYHDLYAGKAYYEQQGLTLEQKNAAETYMDPEVEGSYVNPAADGLHSPSQDLNWAMTQGIPLSEAQQKMKDDLMGAMHNTGYNINLVRYDHANFLNAILESQGVHNPDATQMSVSELNAILKGVKYGENKFVSGSYNDFKNALGDGSKWNKKAFMQRYVKVTYQVDANVQSMMPGISSKKDPYTGQKNNLGEIVMAPSKAGNKNYEIVGVKLSGAKAHPKGSHIDYNMSLNQIELIVKVHKQ